MCKEIYFLYLLTHLYNKTRRENYGSYHFHSFLFLLKFFLLNRYFVVYKPYQVLSQFSSDGSKKSLKDFFQVPSNAYPVGRLDYDSEGLLIITNDKKINSLLLDPKNDHEREYWIQVEGVPTKAQLLHIEKGVEIKVNDKKYLTRSAKVFLFDEPPEVPERFPPIRFRKSVPDHWMSIILKEGKNRQVRKMSAAVGLPTLRLIRYRISHLTIKDMRPGEMIEMNQKDFYNLLRLKKHL